MARFAPLARVFQRTRGADSPRSAGRVVPKERLISRVWPDTSVTDDVLTRSISELRRIFADDPKQPRFIQTIPKGGYRLIALVFPALVTDGPRVYFSEFVDGRWTLAQAPAWGGEVVKIATPFKNSLLVNVSPDGSRLLVRDFLITEKEGPLWVVPASGGAPRRLGDVVAHDGAWSPDGQSVVFARSTALLSRREQRR